MEDTARLIKSLDRRPRQVVIEAKFVEMQLQDDYHLGIQWYAGSVRNGVLSEASVQIPFAQTIYGAFSLGKVTSNSVLEATLLAAAEKGKAKVLSDPKITTLNNKEANINITEQTPYTTEEWSATTPPVRTIKSEYVTTGIILKVTPVINSDGRILMKIKPSVSQVTATTIIGAAPGIDTREADTNVIVKDGETIVIGGLIKDMQSTTVFKIPLLGDIPLLGWLFRKKSVIRSRIELLIFVTPRIMED
jgi:general secretion pathway protein D